MAIGSELPAPLASKLLKFDGARQLPSSLPTTRNMTFCDEFLVTSELFVTSTFHFMTISMRWGGLVTKKRWAREGMSKMEEREIKGERGRRRERMIYGTNVVTDTWTPLLATSSSQLNNLRSNQIQYNLRKIPKGLDEKE
ncbi:hypothetical protein OsI_34564 [Oryza sativa Indica Group]|uniref:Uncharacterized protein n=1 Tax=Oryza sativa subsp. indica TaxID=39946 RepID=A2Z9Z8_ORYSI|nr:hypothetical protein OsI_34564 [Oryza sativa Indica Group]